MSSGRPQIPITTLSRIAVGVGAALLASLIASCSGNREPGRPGPGVDAIVSPAGAGSSLPSLSAGFGRITLGWVEPGGSGSNALRCASWSGSGWSSTRTVIVSDDLVVDPVDPPAIAALDGGAIAAVWSVRNPAASYARDLRFAVSTDEGETWSAPACPHRDGTATEHGFASIVPLPGGPRARLLWLDARASAGAGPGAGRTQLLSALWNGTGFAEEAVVDPKVCDCCRTSGRTGSAGVFAAYRDRSDAEVRDIAVVRSREGGWADPVRVHDDGWALTACPTNGPAIVVDEEAIAVAWFTAARAEPEVRTAFSSDGGRTFASPIPVDAGAPLGRVDATWLGNGRVAVVWAERVGRLAEILVRRVSATGEVSAPVTVGTTAAGRAGGLPRIARVGPDRVLVAWTDAESPSRVRVAAVALR